MIANVIIISVLAVLALLAVRSVVRRGHGDCGCGGGSNCKTRRSSHGSDDGSCPYCK